MYGKLFRQMYRGTLATVGPWQAVVTFQQMIVLADRHGIVDMTAEAMSRETTIPIEILKIGIEALERPDPESRTPDEDGRRIVPLSDQRRWGWRIVNYEQYRKIKSEEEKREYNRQYWQDKRSGKAKKAAEEAQVKDQKEPEKPAESAPVDPPKDVAVEPKKTTPPISAMETLKISKVFTHWQTAHKRPKATLDDKRKKLIRLALKTYTADVLCNSISGYLNSPHHMGKNDRHTVYNDIELLLRDAKHIEDGLQFFANPPDTSLSQKSVTAAQRAAEWAGTEPELVT